MKLSGEFKRLFFVLLLGLAAEIVVVALFRSETAPPISAAEYAAMIFISLLLITAVAAGGAAAVRLIEKRTRGFISEHRMYALFVIITFVLQAIILSTLFVKK